jgi:hypothetical protein
VNSNGIELILNISNFHGGEVSERELLTYDIVKSDR